MATARRSRSTHVGVGEPVSIRRPGGDAAAPLAAAPADDRLAIIVAHGMGQQVPFETLELVAEVLRGAEARARRVAPPIQVRLVALGGRVVPRAEVRVTTAAGRPRDVHLYEAYWAPLTEGRVSTLEALGFLIRSGIQGIRQCGLLHWEFERYMFDRPIGFPIPKHTLLQFIAAMLPIVSLLAINIFLVAPWVVGLLPGWIGDWPGHALFLDLTSDLVLGFMGILAALGLLALLTWMDRRLLRGSTGHGDRRGGPWIAGVGWGLTVAALAILVATAGALIAHTWHDATTGTAPRGSWGPLARLFEGFGRTPVGIDQVALVAAVWGGAICANAALRGFLVQYVGDVAAYVSSHTVSRFNELRETIRARTLEIFTAVYGAREGGGGAPIYRGVVVVGHSLGSVIAYDTLNALLVADETGDGSLAARDRTRMFLTFGSPLDKIAFIYRTQRHVPTGAREALAAAKQPMILHYRYRPARWVNIFSRHDWISGRLEYYDDLDQGEYRSQWVENLEDPEATTPLAAHVEYWRNRMLADRLYQGVTG